MHLSLHTSNDLSPALSRHSGFPQPHRSPQRCFQGANLYIYTPLRTGSKQSHDLSTRPTFVLNRIFCGLSTADRKPHSVPYSPYHFLRAATKETLHSNQRTSSARANIPVDQTGHACLADFGLLTIISEATNLSVSLSSLTHGGTHRWMSSELFLPQEFGPKKSCPTKSSDCYALGMVIYEVLSGRVLQRNFR